MVITYACEDLGETCGWSASHETEEGLMAILREHAIEVHKENPDEWTAETIALIKGAYKYE